MKFTKDEALEKIGKTVRLKDTEETRKEVEELDEYTQLMVPLGTTGKVTGIIPKRGRGQWRVIVDWDVPPDADGNPAREWFSKEEYEEYLEEV
jgi:hypothetical protein